MKTVTGMMLTLIACLIAFDAGQVRAEAEIPAEWQGVWETEVSVYDCETNFLIFEFSETDTLCPGDNFEDPDEEEFTLNCTSSADATSYTSSCEGETEILPGCTAAFTFDTVGTRTGETYSVISTMNISYVGDCSGLTDSCQRTEITGTRIGEATGPCGSTPNQEHTWGAVKSSYR